MHKFDIDLTGSWWPLDSVFICLNLTIPVHCLNMVTVLMFIVCVCMQAGRWVGVGIRKELWEYDLEAAGVAYHVCLAGSDKHRQMAANVDDLTQAFVALTYPTSEKVETDTLSLNDLVVKVVRLEG